MFGKLSPKIYRLNLREDVATIAGHMLECVIIGYNEQHARNLAALHCGKENGDVWRDRGFSDCTIIGCPIKSHNYPQVLVRYVQETFEAAA